MTDRNSSRPCGHIHPNTGWPSIAYCTLEAEHEVPHHSALKNTTWEGQ